GNMSGIGNGFSSGVQFLNENFFVHTGRKFPSSFTELKDNVSKNVGTCAKICTAFLDSSLGLALAMGVAGIVTTSLCAGEDMIDVVATTLLPSITTTLLPSTTTTLLPSTTTLLPSTTTLLPSTTTLLPSIATTTIATTTIATTTIATTTIATTTIATTTIATTAIAASTLSPLGSSEFAYLCASGGLDYLGLGKIAEKNWTVGQFGIGRQSGNISTGDDIYCFSLQDYHHQYPNMSAPECQANDWSGYPNYNVSNGYLSYVYVGERSDGQGLELQGALTCIMKLAFDFFSASDSSFADMEFSALYSPSSMQNATSNDIDDGMNKGAYCWDQEQNITSQFPQYFPDITNCTISEGATLAPLTTTITRLARSIDSVPLAQAMLRIDDGCPPCSKMMLAFGAGSAVVLTATVVKIVYALCKKPKRTNAQVVNDKLGKFLMAGLQEVVLLGAAEVGCGVLFSSLKDVCKPASEEDKHMVVLSTALYVTSAATRLLQNCITSPIEEDTEHEKDVEVELPMLANSTSVMAPYSSSDSNDPEDHS
ncbi:hypothetical protein CLAVI_001041, partial [Candidatus Clavichlamydia salmonicola]|uniref:hypothetical protein n=1 Tax=Candidatus Clavichlamydia salmonicola TaxID=469812 RepID=UPI001E50301E